jgi:ferredoxin
MKVWIDQDLCTGDGLCEEICPSVFKIHEDGLAYVKGMGQIAFIGADGEPINRSGNPDQGIVDVAEEDEAAVREASEECPGECIFIERS